MLPGAAEHRGLNGLQAYSGGHLMVPFERGNSGYSNDLKEIIIAG